MLAYRVEFGVCFKMMKRRASDGSKKTVQREQQQQQYANSSSDNLRPKSKVAPDESQHSNRVDLKLVFVIIMIIIICVIVVVVVVVVVAGVGLSCDCSCRLPVNFEGCARGFSGQLSLGGAASCKREASDH